MKISPRWAESADAVSRPLPHWQYSPKWNRECVTDVFTPPYHCLTCPQVTRLQENVQRGEQDMGAAEGQICTLKEAQDKLLEELDATRARLRETSNLLTALQVCMNEHLCSVLTRRLTCCTLSYSWPDQLICFCWAKLAGVGWTCLSGKSRHLSKIQSVQQLH